MNSMKEFDRIMAIASHPDYIREFEDFSKLHRKDFLGDDTRDSEGRMSAKWGFHPMTVEEVNDYFIKTGEEGQKHGIWRPRPVYIRNYNRNEKTLHLIIRVTMPVEDILKGVRKIVNNHKLRDRELNPKSKGRNKPYSYNQWIVYNMKEKELLSFSQIARKLNPKISKASVDDENYKSTFKAVRRAYNSAKEMIKQVGADAKQREENWANMIKQ